MWLDRNRRHRSFAITGLLVFSATAALAQERPQATGRDRGQAAEQAVDVIRLKKVTVEDETLKQPAFTVLIPADWKASGKIIWRSNVAVPASGTFAALKPGGLEHVVIYAQLPFVDGIAQSAAETAAVAGPDAARFAMASFPEGGSYLGNEIRKQMTPLQYVEEVLVKRGRPDIKNYQVVNVQNMPEWAKASMTAQLAMPQIRARTTAARIRLAYLVEGKRVHEDFFVQMVGLEMLKCVYWGTESASSVRAEAGKLEALQPIHDTILQSVKLDPQWYSRTVQVSQMLRDAFNQQQKHLMEINRIVVRTQNEISKMTADSFAARQKAVDASNQRFSDVIRGVDRYVLPDGQTKVALPSGYSNVWVNGAGEYVLTNNSLFNPNQHWNGNWAKAKALP